jgi:putative ABC transport system substrate-binding protein
MESPVIAICSLDSMSGKWLELLKEIAPWVKRVAVIRDPSVPAGSGGLAAIQTVARSFGVELTPIGVRTTDETERGITAFARSANGGLIVVGPPSRSHHHAGGQAPTASGVRPTVLRHRRRPDLVWC